MRHAARTDANQTQIVEYLRRRGASVQILSAVGKGCPDLLVGYRTATVPVEVKDGSKPPSRQALTPDEALWMAQWSGSYRIVRSIEDAEQLLRDIAEWTACLSGHCARAVSPGSVGAVDAIERNAQTLAPEQG
jgi:hypothetical protein